MAVFREYTSDDSFTKIDDISAYGVSEFQVALTFARDRDGDGKFKSSWDTKRVTPVVITNFKKLFPSAKVLVSIGNDHGQFPFHVDEKKHVSEWIQAATESLTDIIREYNLDGLDVFYETFEVTRPGIFVCCVREVIKNLKLSNVITQASISPNIDTWDTYYQPLYQGFEEFIDNIFLQFFNTSRVVAAENNNRINNNLLEKFKTIADKSKKLSIGYTGIREEWPQPSACFLPPFFFVIIADFRRLIKGASLKVTRDSITYFPPEWVIDVLLGRLPFSLSREEE